MIGSLTKAFISGSCGILVDGGKLNWSKPIASYIPFSQKHDPVIAQRACLSDALSHSTGLPQIDISWYGANGETLLAPEKLLHVVSNIPVYPDFRTKLHYSNWPYALAGRIIEAVAGSEASPNWSAFVQKRIFEKLGMRRSATCREKLVDDNVAEAHTVLSSRESARLPVPDVSSDTICGAAMAIWSTAPDMLLWAGAVLQRLQYENSDKSVPDPGPLRQISQITSHHFRVTEDSVHENTYGFGWARHMLPSSHLGWLSINGPQKDHILGRSSRPRLALYHGGQVTGYLSSLYLFPETNSAVIVLTNAQSLGDCSDWVAQALIQALFEMEPTVDFSERASATADEHLDSFAKMKQEYEENRVPDTTAPDASEVEGSYWCNDIQVLVEIIRRDEAKSNDQRSLEMRLNYRDSQRHSLTHYHYDVFGFLPASRDEKELSCLVDYFSYEQFLLGFIRNQDTKKVIALEWVMQEDFPPLRFERRAS